MVSKFNGTKFEDDKIQITLSEYEFTIIHKLLRTHSKADVLSRLGINPEVTRELSKEKSDLEQKKIRHNKNLRIAARSNQ